MKSTMSGAQVQTISYFHSDRKFSDLFSRSHAHLGHGLKEGLKSWEIKIHSVERSFLDHLQS